MSTVTPTIFSSGQRLDATYEIVSIDIHKEVNRIPYAQIVLLDGDATKQTFPISNDQFFEPGKEIEIQARYEAQPDQEMTLFKGLVMGHRLEADLHGSFLIIELKDTAVTLTTSRKSAVYRNQTDDAIISDILSSRSFPTGTIASTQVTHLELVQYYCTDWDFIRTRADSNGLLTVVNDGEISLQEIDIDETTQHRFEYGITEIYDFEMELDAGDQAPEIQSIGWDLKNQERTQAAKAAVVSIEQGNLDGGEIANTVGFEPQTLVSPIPLSQEELQVWSNSTMTRSRMAMLRGRLAVAGFGQIKLVDTMEVAGIGERFNGRTLVTGFRHRIDRQGWRTDVQFGLSAQRLAEEPDVIDIPAAGLLPAVNGLQIGIVDQFQEDLDKEFRVRVILPSIHETKEALWARLATPEAGKSRGYFFRPEIGDEVVIGFFNGDPRQPVILGAMYSSKNSPPQEMSNLREDNLVKGITTKRGTTIRFIDDEKPSLLIQTPDKNLILLDDNAQQIDITDQHGNAIVMNKDGILIKSAKDLTIEASGTVEIKGKKVNVK